MLEGKAQPPAVQVIIVNWQRPADTLACLESVLASTRVALNVLLVDNGSQDDSCNQIGAAYPQVELLALPANLGFASGYNAGIAHALQSGSPHLFLLNNDTTIEPDAIARLLAAPYDVVTPKILYFAPPNLIWAAGSRWRRLPPGVVMNGYRRPDSRAYDTPGPLDFATGCALLGRREVFAATAGFDPLFENYLEDYDFCYRLRQAGFSLGYEPRARVYHRVSQSLGEGSPRKWRYLGRNSVLFFRRGGRLPWAALWANLAWVSLREAGRGNWQALAPFWKGVRAGLAALK